MISNYHHFSKWNTKYARNLYIFTYSYFFQKWLRIFSLTYRGNSNHFLITSCIQNHSKIHSCENLGKNIELFGKRIEISKITFFLNIKVYSLQWLKVFLISLMYLSMLEFSSFFIRINFLKNNSFLNPLFPSYFSFTYC
jgi:hypothetical protein